jgi:WD40 repeat protein
MSLRLEKTNGAEVHGVHYSEQGHHLLSGHSDGSVQRWELDTGDHHSLHALHSAVIGVTASSDGKLGIAIDQNSNMAVFSLDSNERLGLLQKSQEQDPRETDLLPPQAVLSESSRLLRLFNQSHEQSLRIMTWPIR